MWPIPESCVPQGVCSGCCSDVMRSLQALGGKDGGRDGVGMVCQEAESLGGKGRKRVQTKGSQKARHQAGQVQGDTELTPTSVRKHCLHLELGVGVGLARENRSIRLGQDWGQDQGLDLIAKSTRVLGWLKMKLLFQKKISEYKSNTKLLQGLGNIKESKRRKYRFLLILSPRDTVPVTWWCFFSQSFFQMCAKAYIKYYCTVKELSLWNQTSWVRVLALPFSNSVSLSKITYPLRLSTFSSVEIGIVSVTASRGLW